MNRLRRFVAGAICPGCGRMDKLFLEDHEGHRVRECVVCGFRDVLDRAEKADPASSAGSAGDVQAIRLHDD